MALLLIPVRCHDDDAGTGALVPKITCAGGVAQDILVHDHEIICPTRRTAHCAAKIAGAINTVSVSPEAHCARIGLLTLMLDVKKGVVRAHD